MADNLLEIPQALRHAAEQSMNEAHAAYEQLMDFMTKAVGAWMDAMPANPMTAGFKDVQGRVMEFAKQNAESAFCFAGKVSGAKTLPEVLQFQMEFAQDRMQAFVAQTQEIFGVVEGAFQKPERDATGAIQAEFEPDRQAARGNHIADGDDVSERGAKPSGTERIRERAHELWEQEGRPEGRQDEHWARARREVQMEAENSGSPGAQGET